MKRGLLLINLGTPDAPTPEKVRIYLKEFLMDPYVLDIPYPFRWLLVHGAILPKRPAQSAAAYRKVWTERGSPLLENLEELVIKTQKDLDCESPGEWSVAGGMRYGRPSIAGALEKMHAQGIQETLVLPLYPQYSLAATESSVVETRKLAKRVAPGMKLRFMGAFYEDGPFIDAFTAVARESLEGYDFDHLLFSFHGLPERQVKKTDRTGSHCLASGSCCDRIVDANRDCYRAQCFATARALARGLGLGPDRYSVCFQSRLGSTPWIRPYTDHLYAELPKRGVKKLAVMCPAFVADCLETLEEIQIRGRDDFLAQGGQELRLVPSLNSADVWVRAVGTMAREEAKA